MRSPYLKTRIILPLLLGLLGVAAATGYGVASLERRSADTEMARALKGAEAAFTSDIQAGGDAIEAALPFVCEDRKFVEAFLSRNHSRMQSVTEPVFDRLRKDHVAGDLTLLDTGLLALYCAGEPAATPVRTDYPTAMVARKTGKTATGLEVGGDGSLSLRVVRPWSVAGTVIGYVTASREVLGSLRQVREALGVDAFALIDRSGDLQDATKRAARVLNGTAGQREPEVLLGDGAIAFTPELKSFVASHVGETGTVAEFATQEKQYQAGFLPLNDVTGRRIGRLLVIRDITAMRQEVRSLTRAIVAMSVLAAGVLSLMLYGPARRAHGRLRSTQEELLSHSNHDTLTGLFARRAFLEHLEAVIRASSEKKDRAFALLYLDFDRFKLVNDCVGHQAGDQLLQAVATRLRKALSLTKGGGVCTAGRIGADEFAVLIDPLAAPADACVVAERILRTLDEPLTIKENEVTCAASIGITTSALSTGTADDILRDAHSALRRAQAAGGGRYVVFEASMRTASSGRLAMERDLDRAIRRNELRLFYQPIVRMEDGKLVGFEGLVRWQHPEKGMISPGEFIPLAEETGLILPLGMWVLEEGCRQLREWRSGYPELQLTMSLNLSRKQLSFPDLVQRVEKLLIVNALPANTLKLEITESTVMEHGTQAIGVLHALRALGTQLLMDDFGTGYSSLSCLHRFPLNGIKVDRAFIRNVSERQDYAAVVQAIVSLARNLGMYVVAEGIETQEQVAMLKGIDPDLLGQGYLFSKPIDAKAGEKFIQQHTPLSKAAA